MPCAPLHLYHARAPARYPSRRRTVYKTRPEQGREGQNGDRTTRNSTNGHGRNSMQAGRTARRRNGTERNGEETGDGAKTETEKRVTGFSRFSPSRAHGDRAGDHETGRRRAGRPERWSMFLLYSITDTPPPVSSWGSSFRTARAHSRSSHPLLPLAQSDAHGACSSCIGGVEWIGSG